MPRLNKSRSNANAFAQIYMPERPDLERPKDIVYSPHFTVITDNLPVKGQIRVLATLHRFLVEVRKGGYFEVDAPNGAEPTKILPGSVAVIEYRDEGVYLPAAFMAVRVGRRSWFEAISKGCFRREFLEAITYEEP